VYVLQEHVSSVSGQTLPLLDLILFGIVAYLLLIENTSRSSKLLESAM
jgi:hypothetical protein